MKKILLALVFTTFLSLPAFAANWYWIASDANTTTYIDTASLSYSPASDTAWITVRTDIPSQNAQLQQQYVANYKDDLVRVSNSRAYAGIISAPIYEADHDSAAPMGREEKIMTVAAALVNRPEKQKAYAQKVAEEQKKAEEAKQARLKAEQERQEKLKKEQEKEQAREKRASVLGGIGAIASIFVH